MVRLARVERRGVLPGIKRNAPDSPRGGACYPAEPVEVAVGEVESKKTVGSTLFAGDVNIVDEAAPLPERLRLVRLAGAEASERRRRGVDRGNLGGAAVIAAPTCVGLAGGTNETDAGSSAADRIRDGGLQSSEVLIDLADRTVARFVVDRHAERVGA